uniref:DNA-directed DNA polymerase n=1 Tax=Bracon brevicornis TaxID=1563983 RepID=A0A6V7M9I4_9HYME
MASNLQRNANPPNPNFSSESTEEYFYYIDAHVSQLQTNTVKLFGKLFNESQNQWLSCCVNVHNIKKCLYVRPKESDGDFQLVEQWLKRGPSGVPVQDYQLDYVYKKDLCHTKDPGKKIKFIRFQYRRLDRFTEKWNPPSNIVLYGESSTALERLLTEKGIKRPGWLAISLPCYRKFCDNTTWCQVEIDCRDLTYVSLPDINQVPLKDPPIVATTIQISLSDSTPAGSTNQPEIVMIGMKTMKNLKPNGCQSGASLSEESFFITKPSNSNSQDWSDGINEKLSNNETTTILIHHDEKSLLDEFLRKLHSLQPDIIIIYEGPHLINLIISKLVKYTDCKMNSSQISRYKAASLINFDSFKCKTKYGLRNLLKRPMCYLQDSIREVWSKHRRDDIDTVCHKILGTSIGDMKPVAVSKVPVIYQSKDDIGSFVEHTIFETRTINDLVMKVNILPLAFELCAITGYTLSGNLLFSRLERSEYLLCHAYYKKDYVIPDRVKISSERQKFEGGLALEASIGLHDKIAVLIDFNSLYPSIIQEYNLCFSTMPGVRNLGPTDRKIPNHEVPPGVLPREIEKIIESRREAKKSMKEATSPEIKFQHNIKQLSLKLIANSICGCFGASAFRFYALNLAAMITALGRDILLRTRNFVETRGYEVLFGVTDSLMINTGVTDYEAAKDIAAGIINSVNAQYNYIKIDIDSVLRHVIILNRTQYRFSAIEMTPEGEKKLRIGTKGLAEKPPYTCQLIDDAIEFLDRKLLNDSSHDEKIDAIREYLQDVAQTIIRGDVENTLKYFIIKKKLPDDVENIQRNKKAEIQAAIRYNRNVARNPIYKLRKGDYVEFTIRLTGQQKSFEERAIPQFLNAESIKFPFDLEYYIFQALIPIITKYYKHIPGLTDEFIAASLGMLSEYTSYKSTSKYKARNRHACNNINSLNSNTPGSTKTNEPFVFPCASCQYNVEMHDFWITHNNSKFPCLQLCPKCGATGWCRYLQKFLPSLNSEINKWCKLFHEGRQYICEDNYCKETIFSRACEYQKHGRRFLTSFERHFLEQFAYWLDIFDIDGQPMYLRDTVDPIITEMYRYLKNEIERAIRNNIPIIDLDFSTIESTDMLSYLEDDEMPSFKSFDNWRFPQDA